MLWQAPATTGVTRLANFLLVFASAFVVNVNVVLDMQYIINVSLGMTRHEVTLRRLCKGNGKSDDDSRLPCKSI